MTSTANNSQLTAIPPDADDDEEGQSSPSGDDIYAAMLGANIDPSAAAQQLHQQDLLGLMLQSTGDRAIAPVGASLADQTGQELSGLARTRQALAQLKAEQAYRSADLGLRQNQMNQENALRQQEMNLEQSNEQSNRQLRATLAQLQMQNERALHGVNPDAVSSYVRGARLGLLPPITGYAASQPFGQAVDAQLAQPGPNGEAYDPSLYGARERVTENLQKDDQARALNALTEHLGLLQIAAQGKASASPQLLNQGLQGLQAQLGNAGITSYETGANVVADELSRALLPRGGTEKDRQALQASIAAKLTQGQFNANIGTYRNLLRGQIAAKRKEYSLASPQILNQYLPDIPADEGTIYRSPSTGRRFISIGGQKIEIPGIAAPASAPIPSNFGVTGGSAGGW